MAASLKGDTLLKYIMSATLDSGLWHGTTVGFILHWFERVHQYEQLGLDCINQFPDPIKIRTLQNAVDSIPDLRQVRTVAQQTGQDHTFEQYKSLLLSAAVTYDEKLAAPRRMRNANFHESYDAYYTLPEDKGYDIDTDIATIYANAAMSKSAMVPSERFYKLSSEGKRHWSGIPEPDRKLILQGDSPPSTISSLTDSNGGLDTRHGRGSFGRERDKRRVSFHDRESTSGTAVTETDITDTTSSMDTKQLDLIDSICQANDIDFKTLQANVAA